MFTHTVEAEKDDYGDLPEKAPTDGTDSVEPIYNALGEIRFMHLRQVNIFCKNTHVYSPPDKKIVES